MLKALRRHWNCRLFENAFWQVRHRSEELVAGPAPGAAELNLNVPRWATSWLASQPVPREEVLANPTAQQWLRRRGPPGLSNAVLQALFRQRRVRIWSEQTQQLKRVSRNDVLPAGARLLVPPAAPHSHLGPTSPSPGVRSTGAACDPKTVSRMGSARLKLLAAELREQVLYENEDFVILNKPPGLAVQGGSRIPVSLDDILPLLFESDSGIRPRLVHRLDRHASGALVVALTADAAAWLSAAFRVHSDLAAGTQIGLHRHPAASVKRTYWALVENVPGAAALEASGTINTTIGPLTFNGLPADALKPAGTEWRVLAKHPLTTWLHLQPLTGRKHQLRIHCAEALGRPIIGDSVHGMAPTFLKLHQPTLHNGSLTNCNPLVIQLQQPATGLARKPLK
ncbi:hypothetical protein WJX84_002002 [Apatococcus fuscideae]|uniref:Pseudouridine synthase RsuA/RluA-like domain-containing protein n=1 Tax=Apatococcus fuscideae TaxID=2026836 RepID=A0AAW1TG47_9CHLO